MISAFRYSIGWRRSFLPHTSPPPPRGAGSLSCEPGGAGGAAGGRHQPAEPREPHARRRAWLRGVPGNLSLSLELNEGSALLCARGFGSSKFGSPPSNPRAASVVITGRGQRQCRRKEAKARLGPQACRLTQPWLGQTRPRRLGVSAILSQYAEGVQGVGNLTFAGGRGKGRLKNPHFQGAQIWKVATRIEAYLC